MTLMERVQGWSQPPLLRPLGVSRLSDGDCGSDSVLWVLDSHLHLSNHSFLWVGNGGEQLLILHGLYLTTQHYRLRQLLCPHSSWSACSSLVPGSGQSVRWRCNEWLQPLGFKWGSGQCVGSTCTMYGGEKNFKVCVCSCVHMYVWVADLWSSNGIYTIIQCKTTSCGLRWPVILPCMTSLIDREF